MEIQLRNEGREETSAGDGGAAEQVESTGRERRRPPVTDDEREELLSALDAGELDTLQRRVAFLLNRFPETRDSDPKLYKEYWK
jgi:hypothetical protein